MVPRVAYLEAVLVFVSRWDDGSTSKKRLQSAYDSRRTLLNGLAYP